jgi:uncharacterized membrane protein YfcA
MTPEFLWSIPAVASVAFLYGSVGHGGATGYIAVLTLLGYPMKDIATAALIMNIAVAGGGSYQFWRAGRFDAKLTLPFLFSGIPAAFTGGTMPVSAASLQWILSAVLIVAAAMLLLRLNNEGDSTTSHPPLVVSVIAGFVLGLISGMLGIGGGIFLSPLLVLSSWAPVPVAAATSALFIVANSASGLFARVMAQTLQMSPIIGLVPVAIIGGWAGAYFGANIAGVVTLRRILAAVLLVAAVKALITAQ